MDELIGGANKEVRRRQVLHAGAKCPVLIVLVAPACAERRIVGDRVVAMAIDPYVGTQVVVNV